MPSSGLSLSRDQYLQHDMTRTKRITKLHWPRATLYVGTPHTIRHTAQHHVVTAAAGNKRLSTARHDNKIAYNRTTTICYRTVKLIPIVKKKHIPPPPPPQGWCDNIQRKSLLFKITFSCTLYFNNLYVACAFVGKYDVHVKYKKHYDRSMNLPYTTR